MSLVTSILLWDLWCLWTSFTNCPVLSEIWETLPKTETIRAHSSRAGKPSNLSPVSKEMISDSVELFETAVCFLHIQLIETSVWLRKTHNVPPEVDFESSWSPAKSESWHSPNLHCFAVLPSWNLVGIHMCDEYMKSIDSGVCHKPWSILWLIVHAYSLTIKYRVVQFLPGTNISEQFESMYLTILRRISFLLLWSGGHQCKE